MGGGVGGNDRVEGTRGGVGGTRGGVEGYSGGGVLGVPWLVLRVPQRQMIVAWIKIVVLILLAFTPFFFFEPRLISVSTNWLSVVHGLNYLRMTFFISEKKYI